MKVRLWHIALFVLAFIGFAIARAPASFFAPSQAGGFSYEQSSGTIWNARFEHARLGPFAASLVTWRLSFNDLIQSRLVADLGFSGAVDGDARLLGNWRGDRRIVVNTMAIDGAPLGDRMMLAGTTRITGLDIHFEEGQCRSAEGAVETDVLARNAAALHWSGPNLTGHAVCAGEVARIDLNGEDGGGSATLSLELRPNGAARWRGALLTSTPEVQAALAAAGFQAAADGRLEATGDLRWLPF